MALVEKKYILHMISPQDNVSPFDVNIAYDTGYDAVIPYTNITLKDVRGLVQDAIFSRSPRDARRTAFFICGRDAVLALDMMDAAQKAMAPPFAVSVFPDPSGSFTTAAAMVACIEGTLKRRHKRDMKGLKVGIFGGKGIVGGIAGVLCAEAGARATLIGYDGLTNVSYRAQRFKERFGVELAAADGSSEEKNTRLLNDSDVIMSAARAGIQVLSHEQMDHAKQLLVAADANAVPPAGVAGIGSHDDDVRMKCGAYAIGPFTSGDIKVKTQKRMLRMMRDSETPLYMTIQKAACVARDVVASAAAKP